jgi:hypothetical protein
MRDRPEHIARTTMLDLYALYLSLTFMPLLVLHLLADLRAMLLATSIELAEGTQGSHMRGVTYVTAAASFPPCPSRRFPASAGKPPLAPIAGCNEVPAGCALRAA